MALKKADLVQLWDLQSQGLPDKIKSQLLIPSGRGGVYAARDYIHANAIVAAVLKQNPLQSLYNISTLDELLSLIDPGTRFRLKYYTPCLAYRYDEFKPDAQKQFFADPDWVFTEKMNGARGWIIHYKGTTHLFSRNYSDVDCSVPDYWGNILQEINLGPDEIFAIDCEIMFEPGALLQEELTRYGITTDSKLEAMCALLQMNQPDALEIQRKFKEEKGKDLVAFRMIHPLFYQGKNYVSRKLGEGMSVYKEVIEKGAAAGLNLKPIRRCEGNKQEKENFLNSIIDLGGEGIVGHYKRGEYCTSENRSKTSFVKLKRSVGSAASANGIGDTIDGWISGFKIGSNGTANENLIAAFQISIYLLMPDGKTREHVVAYVPNVAREISLAATVVDESGNITLNPDFYDLVCECDGQAISKVSNRLTHPRLLRYRADKSKAECIYSYEFLQSQVDQLHD